MVGPESKGCIVAQYGCASVVYRNYLTPKRRLE